MWCFGALLYNLCTGRQLFEVDPREEVLLDELKKIKDWSDQVCEEKFETFLPKIKDWTFLKTLLKGLLKRRDPNERYHLWGDIISKLERDPGKGYHC